MNNKHLVISVHGIRTYGKWQERLESLLKQKKSDIAVFNYKYGYFSIFAFLVPFLRWIVTKRFRNSLLQKISRDKYLRIDLVGHSFGTHLIGHALKSIPENKRPKINTIILAGSVLKPNFPWHDFLGKTVDRVCNDCGLHDKILVLNQIFVLFTGMAGLIGFNGMTGLQFRNRFFKLGHSGYFDKNSTFMSEWWLPLLVSTDPIKKFDSRKPNALNGAITYILKNLEPIKLAVYFGILFNIIFYINGLRIEAKKERNNAKERLSQIFIQRGEDEQDKNKNYLKASHYFFKAAVATYDKNVERNSKIASNAFLNNFQLEEILPINQKGEYKVSYLDEQNKIRITADNGEISLIDLNSMKTIAKKIQSESPIIKIQFLTPSIIIFSTKNMKIFVKDLNSQNVTALNINVEDLFQAMFSPKARGKYLTLYNPISGKIMIWDVEEGKLHLNSTIDKNVSFLNDTLDSNRKYFPVMSGNKVKILNIDEDKLIVLDLNIEHYKIEDAPPNRPYKLVNPSSFNNTYCYPVPFISQYANKILVETPRFAGVWDCDTGKNITEKPISHRLDSLDTRLINKGEEFFIYGRSGQVKKWHSKTGNAIFKKAIQHQAPLEKVIFNKAETKLLTVDITGKVNLWSATTGDPVLVDQMTHKAPHKNLAFSNDEKFILSWSYNGTIRLWNSETGELFCQIHMDTERLMGAILSNNNDRIIAWNKSELRSWKLNLQWPKVLRHQGHVVGATVNKNESLVLTWNRDGMACLWDSETGRRIDRVQMTHNGQINGAIFGKNEDYILTWCSNRTVKLWDVKTGSLALKNPLKHKRNIINTLWGYNENRIITVSAGYKVNIWDRNTSRLIKSQPFNWKKTPRPILNHEQNKVLVWGRVNTVELIDCIAGEKLTNGTIKHEDKLNGALFFDHDSKILTWAEDGKIKTWKYIDKQNVKLMDVMEHKTSIKGVIFNKKQNKLLTWSSGGFLKLWKIRDGKSYLEKSFNHNSAVLGATFNNNENTILSWSRDGSILIWDVPSGKKKVDKPIFNGKGFQIAYFSKDGNYIFTYNETLATARVWDSKTGNSITRALKHKPYLYGIQLNATENQIQTYNGNSVRLWGTRHGMLITKSLSHHKLILGSKYFKNDSRIISWSRDDTAKIWNIDWDLDIPKTWLHHFIELRTGTEMNDFGELRTLTAEEWKRRKEEFFSPFDVYTSTTIER